MSDYTKLPHDIADCMKRAGSPLSEDQKLLLAGYLAPVQQKLADSEALVAELELDNAHQRERRNAARDCIQKMKAESLRKQAEAVEDIRKDLLSDLPDHPVSRQVDIRLGLRVNSLREKAERAGGGQ